MAAVASAAARLLLELRGIGFVVGLTEDGRLAVAPAADLDRRLRRLVGRERAALAALLRAERAAAKEAAPTPAPAAGDATGALEQPPRQEPEEPAEVIVGYRTGRGRAPQPVTIPIPRGMSSRDAVAAQLVGCRRSSWDQALSTVPWERD